MRRWSPLLANSQRLDGGSMFGNCPRVVWERWLPPDEQGRVKLACRPMLVEEDERRVLFETGIGAFFEPKLKERYGVEDDADWLHMSLTAMGLVHEDIDVVVLSHLHFDHAGGLLAPWQEGAPARLLFPKATFLLGREAFERAASPHPRDRASFIPGLTDLLEESGRLVLVEGDSSDVLGDGYRFHYSHGHTPGLMMTEVEMSFGPLVFVSDLIPGTAWMHVPISMGYDRYPELLVDEKRALLTDLLERGGSVFFTHDPKVAIGRVAQDERGRFYAA